MEENKSMTEFLKAFVKVQERLQPAKKDSINPHFKSKFANLESCYEACKHVLSENGFVLLQIPWIDETGSAILRTHLFHVSGTSIQGEMFVCPKDVTAQARGSALTYARRYSLVTMVGLATEDDDGNSASHQNHKTLNFPPPKPLMPKIQAHKLAGDFVIDFGKDGTKGKKIKELPREQIEKILTWCQENFSKPEFQEAAMAYLSEGENA